MDRIKKNKEIIIFLALITIMPIIIVNYNVKNTTRNFYGGYFGAIIGILGIWLQITNANRLKIEELKNIEKKDKLGAVKYYIDTLEKLKTNIEKIEKYIHDYSGIKKENRIEERNIYNLFLTEVNKKIFVEMFYKLSMEKDLTKILHIFDYIDYFENVLSKNTNFYSEKYKTFICLTEVIEKHKNVSEKAKEIYDCICNLNRLELIEMPFVKSNSSPREIRKINFKKKNKIIEEILKLTADIKNEYFKEDEDIMYNLSKINFYQWELEYILNGLSENKNFNLKNYETEINNLLGILNSIKKKLNE